MPFIWNLWYFRRKMTFIVVQENALHMIFQICIKAKLFELNVNWHVTPKHICPMSRMQQRFCSWERRRSWLLYYILLLLLWGWVLFFLLILYLTWHTHTKAYDDAIAAAATEKKLRRGSREKRRMLLCWQLAFQPSRENWQMLACSQPADASFPEQTAVLFYLAGSWADIWFTNDNTLDWYHYTPQKFKMHAKIDCTFSVRAFSFKNITLKCLMLLGIFLKKYYSKMF